MHPDIEYFLEGDGSPLTYFQGSIFLRELHEMGTMQRACTWANRQVLVSAAPIAKQNWTWNEKKPVDFRPVVRESAGGVWQVVFYTYSGLGRDQIIHHKDTFIEAYRFDAEESVIALGAGGHVL